MDAWLAQRFWNQVDKFRNSALLLGTLYTITFLILLPVVVAKRGSVLVLAEVLAVMILAAVVVHLMLNFTYVLTVLFPLTMAVVFLITGAALWFAAPLLKMYVGAIGGIFSMLLSAVGAGGSFPFESAVDGYVEFISRLGEAFFALAAAMWWAVEKVKDINQGAIVVYLVLLLSMGFLSGFAGVGTLLTFFLVWLAVFLRLQQTDNGTTSVHKQIKALLKAGATLALLFGTWRITNTPEVLVAAKQSPNLLVALFVPVQLTRVTAPSSVASVFLNMYKTVLFAIGILGIWYPRWILKVLRIPEEWLQVVTGLCARSFFGVLLPRSSMPVSATPSAEVMNPAPAAMVAVTAEVHSTVAPVESPALPKIPRKALIAFAAGALVLIGGYSGYKTITDRLNSPGRVVAGFFRAVNQGEVDKAASYLAFPQAEDDFATKDELKAQLAPWVKSVTQGGAARYQQLPDTSEPFKGQTALNVRFQTADGRQGQILLKREPGASKWKVVLPREDLVVRVNAKDASVEVDGIPVAIFERDGGFTGQIRLFSHPHVIKATAPDAKPIEMKVNGGGSVDLKFVPDAKVLETLVADLKTRIAAPLARAIQFHDYKPFETPDLQKDAQLVGLFRSLVNQWRDATFTQVGVSRFDVLDAGFVGPGVLQVEVQLELTATGSRPGWFGEQVSVQGPIVRERLYLQLVREGSSWMLVGRHYD